MGKFRVDRESETGIPIYDRNWREMHFHLDDAGSSERLRVHLKAAAELFHYPGARRLGRRHSVCPAPKPPVAICMVAPFDCVGVRFHSLNSRG